MGPVGPVGAVGSPVITINNLDQSCNQCHNDSSLITAKTFQWKSSAHGSGTSFFNASNADCAGCHSGSSFSAMVASGLKPDLLTTVDNNPTRRDCRACHQIHTSYTSNDWALETSSAVTLMASGEIFDGGMGNLCVNCHQPRSSFPGATSSLVSVDNTQWGPHMGSQSAMLLGMGGAGLEGPISAHATNVDNTCVTCHMGEVNYQYKTHIGRDAKNCSTCHIDDTNDNFREHFSLMGNNTCETCHNGVESSHSFEPSVAACSSCHPADTADFDINGTRTVIKEKLVELALKLTTAGLLDQTGSLVIGEYPETQAVALWNCLYIVEDNSDGVHNSTYANALLDNALAAFP